MDGWKTITGALLTLVIGVAALFGITPTPESDLPQWAASAMMAITVIYTIYGRFAAKGPAAPQLQSAVKAMKE